MTYIKKNIPLTQAVISDKIKFLKNLIKKGMVMRHLDSQHCMLFFRKKGGSSARNFIREVKPLPYATVAKNQCSGLRVALAKTFCQGFEYITVNVQNLMLLPN
jgi:hypothetical protein